MNKLFFLLVFIIFLSLLSSCVLATDIAYIVKNPANPNTQFISAINELGYSYDLIDDSVISSTNFSNYGMILLGDENIQNAPVNNYKSLIVNPSYYEGWSESIGSESSTGILKAINLQHFITKGMGREFPVYTTDSLQIYYLTRKKYDTKAVTVMDDSITGIGHYIIATKQNPRRVFFGITKTEFWTQESKQLFKNSLTWVLVGEDADNDGYHYDVDCDDYNPDVWQNLPGYLDNDEDSFGAGSLLDVCSGDELPFGYSEIAGDCDDSDFLVNPYGIDIPYNDIDENCDGHDLVDADKDGYVAEQAGGDDCNDGIPEINPGSTDVYKNCKNDAPIIQEIVKITVQETENVIIEVIATDPEGDVLDYRIDDSRFSQDENVFIWETDNEDSGNYVFQVEVNDGEYSSYKDVEVEVKKTNRLPECSEIPAQEWQEDTTHYLNLNDYCSDPDGDYIAFALHDTSEDKNITVNEIGEPGEGNLEFTVNQDWNGEDWIIFKLSDNGIDEVLTNSIVLRVLAVNDAPVFKDNPGTIEHITWNEDENLEDEINLNDYFSDVDFDVLEYYVTGVDSDKDINITITDGWVSFYPVKDWAGTRNVVFSATDGFETADSNGVTLTVNDVGEAPEFQEMNCETEIDEDTEYNCELNASDFENDELTFTISNQNNLICRIENNELVYYTSSLNYNGAGSCLIRAEDNDGYDDFLLEVNVLAVNDAPVITSYSPSQANVKLMENTDKSFSVTANDVDGVFSISWLLDGIEKGTGNNYLFNEDKGDYSLKAVVSDGEIGVSQEWSVFVGDISDFTCSEVNGYICSENEICPAYGELLGVYDTNSCCSISCSEKPPEFSDIKKCALLDERIEIEIKNPDEDDEFKIGETIKAEIKIKNNLEEDLDFDVKAYFYDTTEENKIQDEKDSVDIDAGEDETLEFEFIVEEDLDEENNYAVFVKVEEEDGNYCNEKYVLINIEREKHNVVVQEMKIEPIEVVCGDYVFVETNIKNLGTNDEDVHILIENSELGIREESEEFEIEKYDDNDEAERFFNIKIPENAVAGEYNLKISVIYEDGQDSVTQSLVLEECKKTEKEVFETEKISLEGEKKEAKVEENNKILFLVLVMSTFLILICLFFLFFPMI